MVDLAAHSLEDSKLKKAFGFVKMASAWLFPFCLSFLPFSQFFFFMGISSYGEQMAWGACTQWRVHSLPALHSRASLREGEEGQNNGPSASERMKGGVNEDGEELLPGIIYTQPPFKLLSSQHASNEDGDSPTDLHCGVCGVLFTNYDSCTVLEFPLFNKVTFSYIIPV